MVEFKNGNSNHDPEDRGGIKSAEIIALFDMDGTLTPPRKPPTPEMIQLLKKLKERITVGIVTGSNESKLRTQFKAVSDIYDVTDFIFPENGTIARYYGEPLGEDPSILKFLGEAKLQEVIKFVLHYIADLEIPAKRGTFLEFRTAVLNISPVGRNCSQEERDEFEAFDKIHEIRKKFMSELKEKFGKYGLDFAIGGQISIDAYPTGCDKRTCLPHLSRFKTIYFFGDRTEKGGNDYELYHDPLTIGYSVKGPDETEELMRQLFFNS